MGLLFIAGVIFLVWVLIEHGHHHGHHHVCHHHGHHQEDFRTSGDAPAGRTPRQILDERYARGEIDRQEYLDRRQDIES